MHEKELENLTALCRELCAVPCMPTGRHIPQNEFEIYKEDFATIDKDQSGFIEVCFMSVQHVSPVGLMPYVFLDILCCVVSCANSVQCTVFRATEAFQP